MFLLILAALPAQVADVPNGEQFLRLVAGLHEEIRDISLTCEGVIRLVGPERITGRPPDELGRTFQTGYRYRQRDAATLLDMYVRDGEPGGEMGHIRSAYLRNRLDEAGLASDRALRDPMAVVSTKGATGSLHSPGSAHRILRLWYFRGLSERAARVEPKRWEDYKGHRCLVVEVSGERLVERMWMDLERGGHPLRFEQYHDGNLRMRTDVNLGRLNAGDREYWLPVSGVTETFLWNSGSHPEPIYRETYHVVAGSVVINAGLGDDTFATTKQGRATALANEGELARQFHETPTPPKPPPQRTDADGVRARLDAELAEADRQAAMLQASAPSREWWSWTGLFQALGLSAGFACLVTAWMFWRRQGA